MESLRLQSVGLHLNNETGGFDLTVPSLSFPNKGLHILKGESGSGKTTLLRIIARLQEGYVGEAELPPTDKVFFCPAEGCVMPFLSIRQNLALVDNRKDHPIARALRLPSTNKKARLLSKGEQARLSLAMACASSKEILLLDEPTANLDPLTAETVWKILGKIADSRLVIVATHSLPKSLSPSSITTVKDGVVSQEVLADNPGTTPASEEQKQNRPNLFSFFKAGMSSLGSRLGIIIPMSILALGGFLLSICGLNFLEVDIPGTLAAIIGQTSGTNIPFSWEAGIPDETNEFLDSTFGEGERVYACDAKNYRIAPYSSCAGWIDVPKPKEGDCYAGARITIPADGYLLVDDEHSFKCLGQFGHDFEVNSPDFLILADNDFRDVALRSNHFYSQELGARHYELYQQTGVETLLTQKTYATVYDLGGFSSTIYPSKEDAAAYLASVKPNFNAYYVEGRLPEEGEILIGSAEVFELLEARGSGPYYLNVAGLEEPAEIVGGVSILEKDGTSSNSDMLYLNETSFSTAMENRLAMGSAIGGGGLYGSTSFLQEHIDLVREGRITLEGLGVTEQEIERIELTSSNAPSFFGTVGGIVLAFVLLVYSAYGMLSARKTDNADRKLCLIGSTRKERLVFSVGEVGVSVLPPYLLGTILSLIFFPYWNGAMFSHQLLPHGYLHSFSWGYPASLLAAILMVVLLALPPLLRIYRNNNR